MRTFGAWSARNLSSGEYQLEIDHGMLRRLYEFEVTEEKRHTFQLLELSPTITNTQSFKIKFMCTNGCRGLIDVFNKTFAAEEVQQGLFNFKYEDISSHNPNAKNFTSTLRIVDEYWNILEDHEFPWTFDSQPPVITVQDTIINFCNDTFRNPEVKDNVGVDFTALTSVDTYEKCGIQRMWTVSDIAGNTRRIGQVAPLAMDFEIRGAKYLQYFCDSSISDRFFNVPDETVSFHVGCFENITSFYSYPGSYSFPCPGTENRTTEVINFCTGVTKTFQQTISIVDICPPDACGRNYFPPHGICINGECQCYRSYRGENCEIVKKKPVIAEVQPVYQIKENSEFQIQPVIVEGYKPIYWSLIEERPKSMKISLTTGLVTWNKDVGPGVYNVTVKAENEAGQDLETFLVNVTYTYDAYLNDLDPSLFFQKGSAVKLQGQISFFNVMPEISQAHIKIKQQGLISEILVTSDENGFFELTFFANPPGYGYFEAMASHPANAEFVPQVSWTVLGMMAQPVEVEIQAEMDTTFDKMFSDIVNVTNDGPKNLTIARIRLLNDPNNDDVSFEPSMSGNLDLLQNFPAGDRFSISVHLRSRREFKYTFYLGIFTAEGTSLTVPIKVTLLQIHPKLTVSPSKLDLTVLRGTSRQLVFEITNSGKTAATKLEILLPESNGILTLTSFGGRNTVQDPSTGMVLLPNTNTTMTLNVAIPNNYDLTTINAKLVVASRETSSEIDIDIRVSSDKTVDVTVLVEDEYTYFAEDKPNVSNSTVRLICLVKGVDLSLETSADGKAIFEGIQEGPYSLYVSSPSHSSKKAVVLVELGMEVIDIFLQRTSITYTFRHV